MRLADFDFHLPPSQIAAEPAPRRQDARLYVLPRDGGPASTAGVADLPELLGARFPKGALLVVNDTRVIPARLRGHKESGGKVELLLVEPCASGAPAGGERWLCLGGSSKPLRPGMIVRLVGDAPPTVRIAVVHGAEVEVDFTDLPPGGGGVIAVAERLGEIPLPPYIEREAPRAADRERYQTVYAREPGSVAAPTAGLHLTPALLDALAARGIERAPVTLHVGLGTFAPLRLGEDDPIEAVAGLHRERYHVPVATAEAHARARREGRPILAVGTTSVRTLESALDEDGALRPGPGETRIFLRPGHAFRAVDALLTNFHLPRSSLLMLVSAFAGRERVLAAYADAVARGFRFFSYGDAMLIA